MNGSGFNFHLAGVVFNTIGLAALASLIGGGANRLWLLRPQPELPPELARKLVPLLGLALFVLLITSLADAVLRTADLTDVNLIDAWSFVPKVIRHSLFGQFWLIRFGLVLALIFLWTWWPWPTWPRVGFWTMMLGIIAIVFLISATTHAGDQGSFTWSNVVNTAHICGACLWGGTVAVYAVTVLPRLCRRDSPRRQGVADTASRLSSLAAVALAWTGITGLYNAWIALPTVASLWTTPYGRVLLVKLSVVAVMVSIGAVNRYLLVPALRMPVRGRPRAGDPAHRFLSLLRVDTAVFVLILACAVVLGMQMPPAMPMPANPPGLSSHVEGPPLSSAAGVPRPRGERAET